MKTIWAWISDNADALIVVVTVLGFALTLWQLRAANTSLRASNSYEVQKDAREILSGILTDESFREVLAGRATVDENSLQKLWLMLNFYRSIHRQEAAGGLLTEYVQAIREDFCDFVKKPPVDEGWRTLLDQKRIGDGHVKMRKEWCG